MVELDEADRGLVRLRFHAPYAPGDEALYLARLEEVSARAAPFVLMTLFGGGRVLSREAGRAQALWFKRNRARMDALCRACAIVRPDARPQMAEVFRRLWSFPILATASEAEARDFLARHLSAAAPEAGDENGGRL